MEVSRFRLDWSRPVAPSLPGERSYHATNGERHLLVIATERQLRLAGQLAEEERCEDPDISLQQVVEDAIANAIEARPLKGGELRLEDSDFHP